MSWFLFRFTAFQAYFQFLNPYWCYFNSRKDFDPILILIIWGTMIIWGTFTCREFGQFLDLGPFLGCRKCKNAIFCRFLLIFQLRHPENGPKSKKWPNSQITFGEPMKCNNLAKNWVPNTIWAKKNNFCPLLRLKKMKVPKMYRIWGYTPTSRYHHATTENSFLIP